MAKIKRRRAKPLSSEKFPAVRGTWLRLAEKLKKEDAYSKIVARKIANFVSRKSGKAQPLLTTSDFEQSGIPKVLVYISPTGKHAAGIQVFRRAAKYSDQEVIEAAIEQHKAGVLRVTWKEVLSQIKNKKLLCQELASYVSGKTKVPRCMLSSLHFSEAGMPSFLSNLSPGKGKKRTNAKGLKVFRELMDFSAREWAQSSIEMMKAGKPVSWRDILPYIKDKKIFFTKISKFISKKRNNKPIALFTTTDFARVGLDAFISAVDPLGGRRKSVAGLAEYRNVMNFSDQEIIDGALSELNRRVGKGERKEDYISWIEVITRVKNKKLLMKRVAEFMSKKLDKPVEHLKSSDFNLTGSAEILTHLSTDGSRASGLNNFKKLLVY